MIVISHHRFQHLRNTHGGAAGIVIALVLVLSLTIGGGYWAYNQYYKKPPMRTRLQSTKLKAELIRFTHDHVSRALYNNMILMDDIIVLMNKELDRLKRIGKKFPNQGGIVASQTKELSVARDRLAKAMVQVNATLENMYVTWLVDRSKGIGQIQSKKGTLTRRMADAIRDEAVLVSRIRTNLNTTT